MKKTTLQIALAIGLNISSSSVVEAGVLTEAELSGLAQKDHAAADQWDIANVASSIAIDQFQEKFSSNLFSQVSYGESNHKSLSQFQPIFNPTKNLNVGIRKNLKRGITAEFQAYSSQKSILNGTLQNSTTTGLKGQIDFDLGKNFWGKQDRKIVNTLHHNKKAQELKKYIDSKQYEINARKIYWSIVANRESHRIALQIKAYSLRQLEEAKKRLKLSIGDQGEVTRYKSLFVSSKASIAALNYQHQKLISNLKTVVPSLRGRRIEIGKVNIDAVISNVNICIAKINSTKSPPWELTKVDEYLAILERYHKGKAAELDVYGSPDIKLFGILDYAGKENSSAGSMEELGNDGKPAYQAGFSLNMPLGKRASRTKMNLLLKNKYELTALKRRFQDTAEIKYSEIKTLIPLLLSTVKTAKESSEVLEKTIRDSAKKFEQARVGADTVISDENRWIASLLDQVTTQLTVIHEIYDYLAVYTETPCKINQLN